MIDGKKNTYWATNDAHNNGSLTFTWRKPQALRYVVLQEHIRLGQRVKSFVIETSMDGKQWTRQGGEVKPPPLATNASFRSMEVRRIAIPIPFKPNICA